MEHASCEAAPLLSLLVLCKILVLADSLHSIDHPRCVSAKNTCIFYRTLTLALTCCRKWERRSWVGPRRVALPYVSSCPPLKTVRTTFMVYGLAPAVPLRVPTKRSFPFLQLHGAFPADSLRVRWIPLVRSFRRLGAFATSPHPAVRGFPTLRLLCPIRLCWRALAFRWGRPCLLPTRLPIPQAVARVQHVRRNQDGLGGTFLVAPSTLCGSPVPA
jgi:hypothetical protein